MTRKDYEKIAKVMRSYHDEAESFADSPWRKTAHGELCSRMADMLAQDNSRFDRARFLKACGLES